MEDHTNHTTQSPAPRHGMGRWIVLTSLGLLSGFMLFLIAQYVLGLLLGEALTGGDVQEFGATIDEATGESGFWQDYGMPMVQGMCLLMGPALLQAFAIQRLAPNVRPILWIAGMAIGGAIGGLALASAQELLNGGMVEFDMTLALEFTKLALLVAVAPSIIGALLIRSSTGLKFLAANVLGWGLGVGVGVALVILVVQAQLLGEQIDVALTYVVAAGALLAGSILGTTTGLSLRSTSPSITS